MRLHAFVVKEIASGLRGSRAAVVHRYKFRCDLLPDILFCERPVFYEHIHLNAVPERFMRDHTCHVRSTHAVVRPRHHRLALKEHDRRIRKRLKLFFKPVKYFRPAEPGYAPVRVFDLLPPSGQCRSSAHGPEIVLFKVSFFRKKYLMNFLVVHSHGAVEKPFRH